MYGTLLAGLLAGAAVWFLTVPSAAAVRLAAVCRTRTRPGESASRARHWLAVRLDRRRSVAARRGTTIELCEGLVAELAAGRPPSIAIRNVASVLGPEASHLTPVVVAADKGDDVASALERTAGSPGAEELRLLAACWSIGVERGGAFTAVLEGLLSSLRDREAHRGEIAAELAGPRATARLLAALPILGIVMAAALGARPLGFLFGTLPGAACLVLGLGLDGLGILWTRRLVAAALG